MGMVCLDHSVEDVLANLLRANILKVAKEHALKDGPSGSESSPFQSVARIERLGSEALDATLIAYCCRRFYHFSEIFRLRLFRLPQVLEPIQVLEF